MSWREGFDAWAGSSSSEDAAARNRDQTVSDQSDQDTDSSSEQVPVTPSWRDDATQWLDYESAASDEDFFDDLSDEGERYLDQEQYEQYDGSDEYDYDDDYWDEEDSGRRRFWAPSLPSIRPRYIAAAAVVTLVIGATGAWFLRDTEDSVEAQDIRSSVVGSTSQSTTAAATDPLPVGVPCEQMQEPSTDSLAGAVVAFNTAYYSGDSEGLLETVAEDSYLREQAWEELLPDFAGSTWCAQTSVLTDTTASVDTTVTLPSGTKTTHQQTYEFEWPGDGTARINSISSRES